MKAYSGKLLLPTRLREIKVCGFFFNALLETQLSQLIDFGFTFENSHLLQKKRKRDRGGVSREQSSGRQSVARIIGSFA